MTNFSSLPQLSAEPLPGLCGGECTAMAGEPGTFESARRRRPGLPGSAPAIPPAEAESGGKQSTIRPSQSQCVTDCGVCHKAFSAHRLQKVGKQSLTECKALCAACHLEYISHPEICAGGV